MLDLSLATTVLKSHPEKEIEIYGQIREARKSGDIEHSAVAQWFRERWIEPFAKGTRLWDTGKMFPSQLMSFDNWLGQSYDSWEDENNKAEYWRSCQSLSQEPNYSNVNLYISTRIKSPSLKARKAIRDDREAYDMVRTQFIQNNEKYNWLWRG